MAIVPNTREILPMEVSMDNKTLDLSGMNDEELLKLLSDIQEHINFLNKSIIVIEEDSNENDN